ncbi:DUF6046 domain-containing protein [Dysgonomonas capnocytophagoides]|uniref:DUF6046 domain-containing protein n=1 Tax=Dysgonomonas capnocytophagoides TaxID=45254 RepID=UPI00334270AE
MEQRYNFNEHNLVDIFKSVWGYAAAPFLFSLQNKVESKLFRKPEESDEYSFDAYPDRKEYNRVGSPFYANNNNGNEMFLPIWLIRPDNSRLLLQNTVSSIVNKKTIVETPLVGRQGTVKEEISISDWDINVKGLIVSTGMDYPEDEVHELKELYEQETSLGIDNARTSLILEKGEKIVIRSLRFPELKGMQHIQAFEMDLTSDIPFSLIIE